MSGSQLPAVSSRKVENALQRMGFRRGRRSRGSHQTWTREVDGVKVTTVVQMACPRIPKGTLDSILTLGGISEAEFLEHLR